MKMPVHDDNPNYFALSNQESQIANRFNIIVQDLIPKYTQIVNDKPEWSVTPAFVKDMLSALRRRRISFELLSQVSDRVLSNKWYTLIVAGEIKTEKQLLYCMLTSENNKNSILIPENSKFYEINHASAYYPASSENYDIERDILGLTRDHKFLFSTEYFNLVLVKDIQQAMAAPEDAEGNWIIKSSPMFTPFIFTGRNSIVNATAGTMDNRGRTFFTLSGGNVKWDINNEFQQLLKSNKRAQDLLDYLQHIAALRGYSSTCIAVDTREIKELWNISDTKNFNEQLDNAIKILDHAKISGKTTKGDFDNKKISQDATKRFKGKLIFYFTDEWLAIMKSIKENQIYSPLIQALSPKNCSKAIARKFINHKRFNAGEQNENRISVKNLLEVTDLPLISDLERPSKASYQIIRPFNEALKDIKEIGLFSSRYLKYGGKKLSPQEEKLAKTDYNFWSNLIIEADWITNIDYSLLIEKKEARKEIAAKEAQQPKRKRGRPRKNSSPSSGETP